MSGLSKYFINGVLFSFLAALLLGPFLIGGYLVVQPEIQGRVAGARVSLDLELYPNLSDFNGYAAFNPQKTRAGTFIDELSITSFAGQSALYQGLYQIYNPTARPLHLKVSLRTAPQGFTSRQRAFLVLLPPGAPLSTQLEDAALAGTTLLTLQDPSAVSPLAKKLIAANSGQVVDILSVSDNQVVAVPLKSGLEAHEVLYPESVFIQGTEIIWPQTQRVVLGPQQKTVLSAAIYDQGSPETSPTALNLSIPLQFEASFAPTTSGLSE